MTNNIKNYKNNNFSFELVESGGGFQFLTKKEFSRLNEILLKQQSKRRLSISALETLSIVAYEQPVTKLKVSEIRGVESESSLKTLESRGLIEKSGVLDVPGTPYQYSTTQLFLEKLDLSSIDELPVLGDFFSNTHEEE